MISKGKKKRRERVLVFWIITCIDLVKEALLAVHGTKPWLIIILINQHLPSIVNNKITTLNLSFCSIVHYCSRIMFITVLTIIENYKDSLVLWRYDIPL